MWIPRTGGKVVRELRGPCEVIMQSDMQGQKFTGNDGRCEDDSLGHEACQRPEFNRQRIVKRAEGIEFFNHIAA